MQHSISPFPCLSSISSKIPPNDRPRRKQGNSTGETGVDHNQSTDGNLTQPPAVDPQPEPNPYVWIPIIQTDHPEILEDGSIRLSGKYCMMVEEHFGVWFSALPHLTYQPNCIHHLTLGSEWEPRRIHFNHSEESLPKRLYLQAYAVNETGMGLGQRRRFKIPEALPKWWGNAIKTEGNWLNSPWFGAFKYYELGWLYHAELGWLYASPAEDGVWLWGKANQWIWTKEEFTPITTDGMMQSEEFGKRRQTALFVPTITVPAGTKSNLSWCTGFGLPKPIFFAQY